VNKQETRKLKEMVEIIDVTSDGIARTNTPLFGILLMTGLFKKRAKYSKNSKRTGLKIEEIDLEFRRRIH